MPQINSGKSPPWVSGEIVTAAGLNGMIDSATLDPSAITAQSNFTTLTGDEYTLIVDPVTGLLKKTQLKNIGEAGTDINTDNITGATIDGTLLIEPTGSNSSLVLNGGSAGATGAISLTAKDVSITAAATLDNSGAFTVVSGTGGTTFTSGGTTLFNSKVLFNVTSSVGIPVGTTAQRPATPATGDTRFNSTTTKLEFYNGTSWISVASRDPAVSVLELYEIYEEAIPSTSGRGITVTTSSFTKPTNEVWVFEVLLNATGTYFSSASVSVYFDVYFNSLLQYYYQSYVLGVGSSVFSSHCAKWKIDSATSLSAQPITLNFGPHTTLSINNAKLFIYKYKTA